MPAQDFYRTIPALAQYIDRIGAREKNFRRWLVQEEYGHYYREKCVVKLGHDGTITVSDTYYAPTEAEQAAIRLAFQAGVELPHSVPATRTLVEDDLLPMLRAEHQIDAIDENGDPKFFEFYNQRTGKVIMVQQRIDTREGTKRYIPWSFWSDGLWRAMEPDGDLPFWKPKRATDKTKIMVHEGAKAAKHVTELCADPNCTHPWIEELREFEHWGMIGGALSPHRADYNEIHDRDPELMVYVCDNDQPGKLALPQVSRHYRRTMRGIEFDRRWPHHWDMADPMPRTRDFYSATGRYIGKRLSDLYRRCTWATDKIPAPQGSKARPTIMPNTYFLREWSHVLKPEVYVHNDLAEDYMSEKEFNSNVNPYSDTDDTAKVLRRTDENKAARLIYDPSQKSGVVKDADNVKYINTYVPPHVVPERGDCGPWEDYLEATFPNVNDRKELIRWCATLVCHPNVKMEYGLLLISEMQGVGKSTLGSNILKPLLGPRNCSEPSESTVVDANFNGWCAHKRLAIIHEIYAGHNAKAYDKLKSVITEKTLRINEKYMAAYDIDNWLHVLACSNSKRALRLSMEDRRWLVPEVSERKRTNLDWRHFHEWLDGDGGHAKIKQWMIDWLAANNGPVLTGDPAPDSSTKRDVVREGYGPGGEWAVQFLDRLRASNTDDEPLVLACSDIMRGIKDFVYEGRNSDKMERPATIRKIAKGEGWHVSKEPIRLTGWAERGAGRCYAITNVEELASLSVDELLQRYPRPNVDVTAKAREFWPQF